MVQRIQLLASTMQWYYDEIHFLNLHSYTYNYRASALPLAQEIGLV